MKLKVFVGIGALASLMACQNGSGGSVATQKVPSPYTPTLEAPKFEATRKIDPNADLSLNEKCSDKLQIDPRIRPGQIYSELREGLSQSTQEPYYQREEKTIQIASSEELSYVNSISLRDGPSAKAIFDQKCKKTENNKWSCSTPDFKIIDGPAGLMNGSAKSETCETQWFGDEADVSDKNLSELGYVTVASGEKILAIRTERKYLMKNKCSTPKVAKTSWVNISTLSIPSPWGSNTHCFSSVYTRNSLYDKESGKLIKEDRSALVTSPTSKELGTYPGFENIEALFPKLKAEAK